MRYFPISEKDKRAANLAELQHYGLGTPLVDVSENPFISLLFMVDGYDGTGNEPQLDVFFVREDGKNTLFQEVTKRQQNRRISVQKGAFLNFDKLDLDELSGQKKIPRVCVSIRYIENQVESDVADADLPDGNSTNVPRGDQTLETAVNDIRAKLQSYYYRSEDLFPDFYMYLKVLNRKYADGNEHKQDKKWYQVSKKNDDLS